MTNRYVYPGDKFGRLVVLGRRKGHTGWYCKCDCGNETDRSTSSLIRPEEPMCFKCRKAMRRWREVGDVVGFG